MARLLFLLALVGVAYCQSGIADCGNVDETNFSELNAAERFCVSQSLTVRRQEHFYVSLLNNHTHVHLFSCMHVHCGGGGMYTHTHLHVAHTHTHTYYRYTFICYTHMCTYMHMHTHTHTCLIYTIPPLVSAKQCRGYVDDEGAVVPGTVAVPDPETDDDIWTIFLQYPALAYMDIARKQRLFFILGALISDDPMCMGVNYTDFCVDNVELYGVTDYEES